MQIKIGIRLLDCNWKKMVRATAIGLSAAFVVACSPPPIGCSDQQTVTMVMNAFFEEADSAAIKFKPLLFTMDDSNKNAKARKALKTELIGIRIASVDEKVGRTTCQAQLKVTVSEGLVSLISDLDELHEMQEKSVQAKISKINKNNITQGDGTLSHLIEYTTQYADDGKTVAVTLSGHRDLATAVGRIYEDIITDQELFGTSTKK